MSDTRIQLSIFLSKSLADFLENSSSVYQQIFRANLSLKKGGKLTLDNIVSKKFGSFIIRFSKFDHRINFCWINVKTLSFHKKHNIRTHNEF